MRIEVIRNDTSSTIETEITIFQDFRLEEGIYETYPNIVENVNTEINFYEILLIKIFIYKIIATLLPPIPFLDIYYAYKYESVLDKYSNNVNISIKDCLLFSGFLSSFIILFILPVLVLMLVSNNFYKKIKPIFEPFFIICVYIIPILFMTIWYLIQIIILIGIGFTHDTYGYDYTIITYLILTSIVKLAFGFFVNLNLCKRLIK
jgi:hypothetical protein